MPTQQYFLSSSLSAFETLPVLLKIVLVATVLRFFSPWCIFRGIPCLVLLLSRAIRLFTTLFSGILLYPEFLISNAFRLRKGNVPNILYVYGRFVVSVERLIYSLLKSAEAYSQKALLHQWSLGRPFTFFMLGITIFVWSLISSNQFSSYDLPAVLKSVYNNTGSASTCPFYVDRRNSLGIDNWDEVDRRFKESTGFVTSISKNRLDYSFLSRKWCDIADKWLLEMENK